ncbi:MAG: ABC transporter permease [Bacteroidales bacterium]|jgi:putative ABC transport system permease protein|nr:ABC transporter permease [Bacteroidales bacterium]
MNKFKLKLDKYLLVLSIASKAILENKVRSLLTALGIIFGVAAVISMLAIGSGAKKEVLDQMKLVGVNNIVITPRLIRANETTSSEGESEEENDLAKAKLSPGLNLEEAAAAKKIIPTIQRVSPEVTNEAIVVYANKSIAGDFTGITPDFFEVYGLELNQGKLFVEKHYQYGEQVCIIGHKIKSRLFPTEEAIGKQIKCGDVWLRVIGVLKSRGIGSGDGNLGIDDFNMNVYAPIQTALLRFNDRSVISKASLVSGRNNDNESSNNNRNQLDKIVVQVKEASQLQATANVLQRMLERRHAGAKDFRVIVPELLLKQEQKTRNIFNIVLGAIASISLIVGGIGIMNIMLASVMERIREIGVRRAIGATQNDVILQFLTEATLISVIGGIIGIFLGLIIAFVITQLTGILTIVSGFSILISFGVSAGIGVLFGYMPAKKAALQDPVTSLRHE